MVNSTLSQLKLVSSDLEGLDDIASRIIEFSEGLTFWIFEGDMGLGKTTLIKSICKVFNVVDLVSSPTYSIVNEYQDQDHKAFYHFDFYRLNSEEEALDIGVEEYFYSGDYCFIEWPSKVPSLLPTDQYLLISLRLENNNQRVIEVTRHV